MNCEVRDDDQRVHTNLKPVARDQRLRGEAQQQNQFEECAERGEDENGRHHDDLREKESRLRRPASLHSTVLMAFAQTVASVPAI